MRTITITLAAANLAAFVVAGCTSDDGSGSSNADRVVATCSRLDECNILEDLSEQECVDILNTCVQALPRGYQHDWGVIMDECLDLQSCSLFGDCVVIPCE